jgi:hypothetical protein
VALRRPGKHHTHGGSVQVITLDPWRIGAIVAAALVLLHYDHARTT